MESVQSLLLGLLVSGYSSSRLLRKLFHWLNSNAKNSRPRLRERLSAEMGDAIDPGFEGGIARESSDAAAAVHSFRIAECPRVIRGRSHFRKSSEEERWRGPRRLKNRNEMDEKMPQASGGGLRPS